MTQATDFDELSKLLEGLVRRVVREELANFARENGMFYLAPGSPLYEDMEKIIAQANQTACRADFGQSV